MNPKHHSWRQDLLNVQYQLEELAAAFEVIGNVRLAEQLTRLSQKLEQASQEANKEVFDQIPDHLKGLLRS